MATEVEHRMDNTKSHNLYDSAYCRLCCEENTSGINLFKEKFDNQNLFALINVYLPIIVSINLLRTFEPYFFDAIKVRHCTDSGCL